jgi:hypothetical protein
MNTAERNGMGPIKTFPSYILRLRFFTTPTGVWISLRVVNECNVAASYLCFGEAFCFHLKGCNL